MHCTKVSYVYAGQKCPAIRGLSFGPLGVLTHEIGRRLESYAAPAFSEVAASVLRSRLQQVGQTHPVQHFGPQPIKDRETDISAIMGRIVIDTERAFAERRVHRFDDQIGDRLGVCVVGEDGAESLLHLLAEPGIGTRLVLGGTDFVRRAARMCEVIGALGEGARHDDCRLDTPASQFTRIEDRE